MDGRVRTSPTPDWEALADAEEARRRRRGRLAKAAAALALGGLATGAVALSGEPEAQRKSAGEKLPEPAPPPPFTVQKAAVTWGQALIEPALDSAPFTAQSLFPMTEVTVDGRRYLTTAGEAVDGCRAAPLLAAHGCLRLARVTLTGPEKTAVTVGVAMFPDATSAAKAFAAYGSSPGKAVLETLDGGAVRGLCPPGRAVRCGRTAAAPVGRYLVLTAVGRTDGGTVPEADWDRRDSPVSLAAEDLQRYVHAALRQRGEKTVQSLLRRP